MISLQWWGVKMKKENEKKLDVSRLNEIIKISSNFFLLLKLISTPLSILHFNYKQYFFINQVLVKQYQH